MPQQAFSALNGRPTVLIAEDDPVVRRVLTVTVAKCGYSLEAVSDGQAAFDRLVQGGIDFLITDQQMPRCTGCELLERLARVPAIALPPTIVCTAKGFEFDRVYLQRRFGLLAVLHKPFSPRQLAELLMKNLLPATAVLD